MTLSQDLKIGKNIAERPNWIALENKLSKNEILDQNQKTPECFKMNVRMNPRTQNPHTRKQSMQWNSIKSWTNS